MNNKSSSDLTNEAQILANKLGANIAIFRKKILNETVDQFAARISSSRSTVYRIESGDLSVSFRYWANSISVMNTANAIIQASMPEVLYLASMFKGVESIIPEGWDK